MVEGCMRFNVSQKKIEEIKQYIEEDMSWKINRKDTPKARAQLSNLPLSSCIVCMKTKEVIWVEVYGWEAKSTEKGLIVECWIRRSTERCREVKQRKL